MYAEFSTIENARRLMEFSHRVSQNNQRFTMPQKFTVLIFCDLKRLVQSCWFNRFTISTYGLIALIDYVTTFLVDPSFGSIISSRLKKEAFEWIADI